MLYLHIGRSTTQNQPRPQERYKHANTSPALRKHRKRAALHRPAHPDGKSISSKNSVTHGLFSGDFIRPDEESDYATIRDGTALFSRTPARGLPRRNDGLRNSPRHLASPALRRSRITVSPAVPGTKNSSSTPWPQIGSPRPKEPALRGSRPLPVPSASSTAAWPNSAASGARNAAIAQPQPPPKRSPKPRAHNAEPNSSPPKHRETRPCLCGSGQKFKRCCGKEAPPMLRGLSTTPKSPHEKKCYT